VQPPIDRKAIYIFVDMDDVIADFAAQAKAYNIVLPDGELVDDGQNLDFNWWSSMPVISGAREFYDNLTKLGKVRFLTGPKHNPDCFAGKAQWIRNFLPERDHMVMRELIICTKNEKWLLAGPNRILVDDRKSSTDIWTQAGGIGVHHKGNFEETLEQVKLAVEQIKESQRPYYNKLLTAFTQAVGRLWGHNSGPAPRPPQAPQPG
jgi:5'(3')-deoxyribonucleotidase